MSDSDSELQGPALMRSFLDHSPFARELELKLVSIEEDWAQILMPFREGVATYGDIIHGGAICSLVDVAATAAAWSGARFTGAPKGATVGVTVDFLCPAQGVDLQACASVIRRGRQLCFCDVGVTGFDDGLVAKGLVTYRLG